MADTDITAAYLRETYNYDPASGCLTKKHATGPKPLGAAVAARIETAHPQACSQGQDGSRRVEAFPLQFLTKLLSQLAGFLQRSIGHQDAELFTTQAQQCVTVAAKVLPHPFGKVV